MFKTNLIIYEYINTERNLFKFFSYYYDPKQLLDGKTNFKRAFENKNKHIEDVPEIDKNEFIKTVKSRRSVRTFTNEPVLEKT